MESCSVVACVTSAMGPAVGVSILVNAVLLGGTPSPLSTVLAVTPWSVSPVVGFTTVGISEVIAAGWVAGRVGVAVLFDKGGTLVVVEA